MRSILLSAAAFAGALASVHTASAAPVTLDWNGPYVGLNAGYGWSTNTDSVRGNDAFTQGDWEYPGEINSPKITSAGFMGGGQLGYNMQVAPTVVAGLEADIQGGDVSGVNAVHGTDDTSRVVTGANRMDLFGTVRARVGYVAMDRALIYATAGVAYADDHLATGLSRPSGSLTGCEGHANNCESGATSATNFGWTVGGGLEWKLDSAWSVKGEYLYYDLGSISHLMTDTAYPSVFRASLPLRGNLVRVGINYRFGH